MRIYYNQIPIIITSYLFNNSIVILIFIIFPGEYGEGKKLDFNAF